MQYNFILENHISHSTMLLLQQKYVYTLNIFIYDHKFLVLKIFFSWVDIIMVASSIEFIKE